MIIDEGVKWDGQITFSVLQEEKVKHLLNDIPLLVNKINARDIFFEQQSKQKNKITNYARQTIAQILSGGQIILPSQIELGTGSGTASATDTDLWSPTSATMQNLAYSITYANYYMQYVATWQSSDTSVQGTWTEVGLFDNTNNLWAHATVSPNITVSSGQILVCQWQVQILGN